MTKNQIEFEIQQNIKGRDWWMNREIHAAWNDDGKGGHINSLMMVKKMEIRIELLKQLLAKYY